VVDGRTWDNVVGSGVFLSKKWSMEEWAGREWGAKEGGRVEVRHAK
jgi:hypothetical protein